MYNDYSGIYSKLINLKLNNVKRTYRSGTAAVY